MPKTRHDYELQHQEDNQKLNDYENIIQKSVHKINFMEIEIKRLNAVIAALESENLILKNEAEYVKNIKGEYQTALHDIYWAPKSNERRAGRKPKLNETMVKYIKKFYSEGHTQKEIAEILKISIGLVNKACNMPDAP